MPRPNTVTMQYIDLYSCRTVQLPSVWLSQKHELAVCSPAPFFCMMMQLTANMRPTGTSNCQVPAAPRHRRRGARQDTSTRARAHTYTHTAHTHSPTYLNGFCKPVNFFITPSITSEVHCGTFSCSYVACCARARANHSSEKSVGCNGPIAAADAVRGGRGGRHTPLTWPQLLPAPPA